MGVLAIATHNLSFVKLFNGKFSVSNICLVFLSLSSFPPSILLLLPESNRRISGGAMQLSFTQLTIDYYPYHKAGVYNNYSKDANHAFKMTKPFFLKKSLFNLSRIKEIKILLLFFL